MHPFEWQPDPGIDDDEQRLVRECELFVGGRLAPTWLRLGRAAPGWAWLSMLAHADAATLEEYCWRPGGRPGGRDGQWLEVVGYVATLLFAIADTGGPTIEQVQRRVLRPLERRYQRLESLTPVTLQHLVTSEMRRVGAC